MAEKIDKVTVMIRGTTKVIPKRALKMAKEFFGAVEITAKELEPPYEIMQRPRIESPKILRPETKEVKEDPVKITKPRAKKAKK